LSKDKTDKSKQCPETHAHDAVALTASHFMQFESFHTANSRGHHWVGAVQLSPAPFRVITRPNLFRRQLHFENFSKGGIRKRKGGTITPWRLRSGDFVKAEKAGKIYFGWIGGYSEVNRVMSIYDHNWRRQGQFSVSKVQLVRKDNGLCIA